MPNLGFQPGDHIAKPGGGRYLGTVIRVEDGIVHYRTPAGVESVDSRRHVRRTGQPAPEPVPMLRTAVAEQPGRAVTAFSPDDARHKTGRTRELREGSYQFGAATVIASVEPAPRRSARIGNVIRVTAAGREVVVRLTPAGKNATITVDGWEASPMEGDSA